RYAQIQLARDLRAAREWPAGVVPAVFNPKSLAMRIGAVSPTRDLKDLNTPPFLRVEMPSVNGVASARAVARTYAEFATGGTGLGVRPETIDELQGPGSAPSETAMD